MFSFLKSRAGTPSDQTPSSQAAPGDSAPVAPSGAQDTDPGPAPADSAAEPDVDQHPLAAMVWDAPDVPRADDGPSLTSSYGLDVGALLEPPASESSKPAHFGEKDQSKTDELKPAIVDALSTIYDPEIPVNIYELGLIYDIESDADGRVLVTMTLTSPACPSAQQLPAEAKFKTKAVPGVTEAHVDVVWEPTWTKDMMSETARLALGMF
jgi:FeS assembly SUF system protein